MAYTPPAATAVDFTLGEAYVPPAADAVDFDLSTPPGGYEPPPVPRYLACSLHAPWAAAQPRVHETRAPYGKARAVHGERSAPWGKHAKRLAPERRAPWGVASRADAAKQAPWGRYATRPQAEPRSAWLIARALDAEKQAPWGQFAAHLLLAVQVPWMGSVRAERERRAPWGKFAARPQAAPRQVWATARPADAERWLPWVRFSKQLAPGWGVVVPDGTPPTDENGTVIVPVRSVYVTINSLSLITVPGGDVLPAAAFTLSLDADSWTWQWSATLQAAALPFITPGPGGDPAELQASINGQPIRLTVDAYARERRFGSTRINVRGRGRAAILDAPYAPVMNFSSSFDRTAQQLANQALTISGVGIGWDVDWQLTDWMVPANTWVHQGSYIAALLDIAEAGGGYVQPHDTAATLRILPRYPAAPWEWALHTPDEELPASVVSVEATDWVRKAAYNRVYASGTTTGVRGQVTRTGTAGNVAAPPVMHPLITHADAARQRGLAVLADTGSQALISLRLPVLEGTGLIKPGTLVRYIDAGVPRLGLSRSLQVDWQAPTLRQTIELETHLEA